NVALTQTRPQGIHRSAPQLRAADEDVETLATDAFHRLAQRRFVRFGAAQQLHPISPFAQSLADFGDELDIGRRARNDDRTSVRRRRRYVHGNARTASWYPTYRTDANAQRVTWTPPGTQSATLVTGGDHWPRVVIGRHEHLVRRPSVVEPEHRGTASPENARLPGVVPGMRGGVTTPRIGTPPTRLRAARETDNSSDFLHASRKMAARTPVTFVAPALVAWLSLGCGDGGSSPTGTATDASSTAANPFTTWF